MNKDLLTHQGASQFTERKEFEIEGVSYMRATQFKNKHFRFRQVIFADVFCGSGKNTINAEYIVDGSPLRLLSGFARANNSGILPYSYNFWFSDIRQSACAALEKRIKERFDIPAYTFAMEASTAINTLGDTLNSKPDSFLFLIIDPNGPKDFPKYEVQDLLASFPGRIDVIPYISATTINRCLNARNKAGRDFKGWLGEIENFDEGFVSALSSNKRFGWIRKPIPGDRQRWTMIPTFGCFEPRNSWEKQGYVKLNSAEGKEIVKFYCGGNGNE